VISVLYRNCFSLSLVCQRTLKSCYILLKAMLNLFWIKYSRYFSKKWESPYAWDAHRVPPCKQLTWRLGVVFQRVLLDLALRTLGGLSVFTLNGNEFAFFCSLLKQREFGRQLINCGMLLKMRMITIWHLSNKNKENSDYDLTMRLA